MKLKYIPTALNALSNCSLHAVGEEVKMTIIALVWILEYTLRFGHTRVHGSLGSVPVFNLRPGVITGRVESLRLCFGTAVVN